MTTSKLRAKFERLGPTLAADPVQSGSPEIVTLRLGAATTVDTIAAILTLRRAGLTVLKAKRTIEATIDGESIIVRVPRVADAITFVKTLEESGFEAHVRSRDVPNVQALRDRLGLTQEQFATRFGLDVDAVRNWEHARRTPDMAAQSLLRVISRYPAMVADAQDN